MPALTKFGRAHVATAVALGRDTTPVLLLARGDVEPVEDLITELGGEIRYREPSLGYLRAVVPLSAVRTLERSDLCEAFAIDSLIPRNVAKPGTTEAQVAGNGRAPRPEWAWQQGPNRETPAENPFLPTRDIGAPQFVSQHPTFDGRGTTVGILDSPIDPMAPELARAYTLEGESIRKVADILVDHDADDEPGPTWIREWEDVQAVNRRFETGGKTYLPPYDGPFRLAFFDPTGVPEYGLVIESPEESQNGAEPEESQTAPAADKGELLFPVLWDPAVDLVWFDVDRDRQFGRHPSIRSFAEGGESGFLPVWNPADLHPGIVMFSIQVQPERRAIQFIFRRPIASHGDMVAGISVGNGFLGGAFNGVAPGARLVSTSHRSTMLLNGYTEGVIRLARHPDIDVISLSLGTEIHLGDGQFIFDLLCNRVVERWGISIAAAAGNYGPALQTAMISPALGDAVISVGGYVHRETWRANLGVTVHRDDMVRDYSSRGPRGDGALKPDILSPSLPLSLGCRDGQGILAYPAPSGLELGGGTSSATPGSAGSVALLLSAARQAGVVTTPAKIKRALVESARLLPDCAPVDQGNGLTDVPAAWELLQRLPDEALSVTVRAPVKTVLSQRLPSPDAGRGLFEREGWAVGDEATRSVRITRHGGDPEPLTCSIRWIGNDGAFSAPSSVTLPLGQEIEVPVTITAQHAGVWSAVMVLESDAVSGAVCRTPCTIVVPEAEATDAPHSVSVTGRVEPQGWERHFVQVPDGATALWADLSMAEGSARLRLHDPGGHHVDYPAHLAGGARRGVADPQAGVWELVVHNGYSDDLGDRDLEINPIERVEAVYAFSVQSLGVEVSTDEMAQSLSGSAGTEAVLTLACRNRFAPVTCGVLAGSLAAFGRRRFDFPSSDLVPQRHEIVVPEGADRLVVRLTEGSAENDFDLYLYEATPKAHEAIYKAPEGEPTLKYRAFRPGPNELIDVYQPNPGRWVAVVDPVSVPADDRHVVLEELIFHPAYGRIEPLDPPAHRQTGEQWRERAQVAVGEHPDAGRERAALVVVGNEELRAQRFELRYPSGPKHKFRYALPLVDYGPLPIGRAWLVPEEAETGLGEDQEPGAATRELVEVGVGPIG